MRKFSILLALVAGLFISEARADFTAKDAAAATITFKNPGTCTAVVCVPVVQLYDGTNVVTLTTAGGDAVSNTLTGVPTYARMLQYNGTTWDRWQGAVSATLAAETTKVIGTVRIASGGVASGAFASGALASGSIAAGAQVDLLTMRQTVVAGTVAANSLLTGGIYNSTPITMTNGQGAAAQFDVNGYLKTNVTNTNANGQAVLASSSPVAVAKNSGTGSTVAGAAVGTAGTASAEVVTIQGIASMTPILARPSDGTNSATLDPCQSEAKSTLPITLATAAVKVIAVGVSAKKIYVCQIHLTNNAADSIAIFEATTATTCATSPVAVVGAGTTVATAGTGYNFSANGGISLGTGVAQVLQTSVNANDLCIAQSAATQLTGSVTYVTR